VLKEALTKLDHENFIQQKISGQGKSNFNLDVFIETSPGIYSDFICEYNPNMGIIMRAK